MDIAEFLNARLNEADAAARACADNDGNLEWHDSPVQASLGDHTVRTSGARPVARIRESDNRGDESALRILSPDAVAAHIADYDPARALAEVATWRAILAAVPPADDAGFRSGFNAALGFALQTKAREYSDHPDWRRDGCWGRQERP